MAPRTLASAPVNFGDKFDPSKMRVVMDHISRMTAEIQKIQQLLADGTAGQVLTKTDRGDYLGRWADPSGGGGSISGAQNIGNGAGLYAGVSGGVLQFKTLLPGNSAVQIQYDDDEVFISFDDSVFATKTYVDDEISALGLVYQPLSAPLTSITELVDAAGVLTNDGTGVLSWGAGGGAYTAGDGLSLAASEFEVDLGFAFTWTGNHDFNGNQTRFTGTFGSVGTGSGVEVGMSSVYGFTSGFMLSYDRTSNAYLPFAFEGDGGAFLLSEGGVAQFSGNLVSSVNFKAVVGVELGSNVTRGFIQSVDRSDDSSVPLDVYASQMAYLLQANSDRFVVAQAGGAEYVQMGIGPSQFMGTFGASGYTPVAAPSVEIGYSSGFSGAFIQAYDWNTLGHIPMNFSGKEIGFRVGASYDLAIFAAESGAVSFPGYGVGTLQTDSDGLISAVDLSLVYQPIATILTTLSGLADAAGVLTNDGSGNLSWV
jgi:hypothetical protein